MATLTKKQWDAATAQIVSIFHERQQNPDRVQKARIWEEVDRQVAMRPVTSLHHSGLEGRTQGHSADWLPNTELPLQASALEVLQADARQLTFPRDNKWFLPHSNVSDDYIERWNRRRQNKGIGGDEPGPMEMTQKTADILVKAVMNHFHRLFNFRRAADAMDISAFKYGTYATRVRKAELPILDGVFRGSTVKGPAAVPINIKNLYLDDKQDQVTMEGQIIAPATIRVFWRRPSGLKAQARGDVSFVQMNKLDTNNDNMVLLIEYEGDLVVPMSRETIFAPNMTIWVALNAGGPTMIRRFENENKYRSIIYSTYMNDEISSPYGTSPLMKGQPIQELATKLTNDLATASALSARPPVLWDNSDGALRANGGPNFFPGSQTESDDPFRSVNIFGEWAVAPLESALRLALSQYEDLTGVTAPRRGAAAKSHTTAFAAEVESVRGLVRTDDYVQAKEKSVLEPILQMEYEVIKDTMVRQPILVNDGGMEGFVNIGKEDLPDEVIFEVLGSSGPLTERQKQDRQFAALNAAAQFNGLLVQQGQPPVFNVEEAIKEILSDAFTNTDRFITRPESVPEQPPGATPIQAVAGGGGRASGGPVA